MQIYTKKSSALIVLNALMEWQRRMSNGRAFHYFGAVAEKVLLPNDVDVLGVARRHSSDEGRFRIGVYLEETADVRCHCLVI